MIYPGAVAASSSIGSVPVPSGLITESLVAYFRADTSAAEDEWVDARGAGQGVSATQSTPSAQPTIGTDANGAYVEFDADTVMDIVGLATGTDLTVYAVSDVVEVPDGYNYILDGGGARFLQGGAAPSETAHAVYLAGFFSRLGWQTDIAAGQSLTSTWQTGDTSKAWRGRVQTGEQDTTGDGRALTSPTIGRAGQSARVKFRALLIYDGHHTDEQRAQNWTWIATQWPGYGAEEYVPGSSGPYAYDTVILAGQSNAKGTAPLVNLASPYDEADPSVIEYNSTPPRHRHHAWDSLGPVDDSGGYGFGVEVSLMRDLADDAGWPNPALFKSAQGSTGLVTHWLPSVEDLWPQTTEVYDRAAAVLPNEGDSLNVRALVWIQGERDALTAPDAAAYETNLTTMVAAFRAKWGAGLPVYLVRLGAAITGYDYEADVIAGQNAVAAADADVHVIAAGSPYQGDGVHYTAGALVSLGQTIAAQMIADGV